MFAQKVFKAMADTKVFNIHRVKHFLVFISCLLGLQISAQQFSRSAVLSDLEYLRSSLEATHFDLYAYTSKKAFEENYSEVRKQIKSDSLTLLEVINLFQRVVSRANNAHTRIVFPVQPYIAYAESGGRVFPLEVAIENGKALVRKNWSTNASIPIGAELKAINGMPIDEVFREIYPQISAERLYFKNAQLEGFTLPRFYWQVFGEQQEFQVEIVHNGRHSTQELKAIKAMEEFEMKRDDILKRDRDLVYPSNSTAYLRPGEFGGEEDLYRQFIDSAFADIHAKMPDNLIIDLRNNPGGDDAFSDYLVSYIADKPFKWASRFQLKTNDILKEHVRQTKDTTEAYWKSVLAHKSGAVYEFDFGYHEPQPQDKRYNGRVYVLVNRHSYSQAAVTASQIQDYGFGQIVGEETAEFPNLYASIFSYKLPETGINVDVSKGKIQRVSGTDNKMGVIPDIRIKDHLLDENDEVLDGLLKQIENKF
ncbi:S41 family peptidase [Robiginitalea sp. SC105]|uniref:S41 family peptidase n=1 Tax=Robiginitalea sp. SC105 TaxID=2762332 RepID=UPI00163AD9AB|nr:S41 family peptidase [Robiginitalea sp. SC105]MBC2838350.1 peptidase S41 [Robiginitalea sp. SC105]